MNRALLFILTAGTVLGLLTGCGDGRPRRYQVTGIVQVDGKPLTGEFVGSVRFCPIKGGRPASAQLDNQGRFVLGNYASKDGCPIGDFKVEVNVSEQKNNKMRYLVPPRYWKHDTSDIVVNITGKKEELVINTEWKPEDARYKKMVISMNE